MQNNNNVELLKSQNKKLTEDLAGLKANIASLESHIIRHAILRNHTLQTRTLDPEAVAAKLAGNFKIEMVGGIPRIKSKEGVLSLRGGFADVNEAVDAMLTPEMLLPEQAVSKADDDKQQPSQPKDANLNKLKAAYAEAKSKGNGTAMVAIKRQLAEVGSATAIL